MAKMQVLQRRTVQMTLAIALSVVALASLFFVHQSDNINYYENNNEQSIIAKEEKGNVDKLLASNIPAKWQRNWSSSWTNQKDVSELNVGHSQIIQEHSITRNLSTKNQGEVELPPCSDILLHETPEQRCDHATNCDSDGEFLISKLLPLAFCTEYSLPRPITADSDNTTLTSDNTIPLSPMLHHIFPVLFPLSLVLFTLLLFRLLASTAQNYFSPALEMICTEFRIPPSLAGVTLLALGNGAPDVSAVVNAIKTNASEGIPLSLGELTGGGIFVQSVVVGRVVVCGGKMMMARGAIDGKVFADGKEKRVEKGVNCRAELLRDISMYGISAGYVFWMCGRGVIYYRHVLFMFLLYGGYVATVFAFEIRRYYSNVDDGDDDDTSLKDKNYASADDGDKSTLLQASMPSYDEEDHTLELSKTRRQPISRDPPAPHRRELRDRPGDKYSSRILRVVQMQKERQKQERKMKSLPARPKSVDAPVGYSIIMNTTAEQNPKGHHDTKFNWDLIWELLQDLVEELYSGIWRNQEAPKFELALLLLEYPFIIIRKLVIPIPCEAEYNRSMVALSITFSPLWLCFYFSTKMEGFDPYCRNDSDTHCSPSVILWPCFISYAIGSAFILFAPKVDSSSIPLRYKLPIALYGFLIAATWIDVISDQLVNILEFIGVVCRIPAPIMGMTVLAWGNSVGDFTTNAALAQKGLADMSMAACFAGPSFNLLIGLGSGLLTQKESLMSEGLTISLMPSVKTGFLFLICNCLFSIASGVWHQGYIPSWHAYVFFAMYFGFIAMNAQHLLL